MPSLPASTVPISRPLTIAVPKGRILDELTPLLGAAGVDVRPFKGSRKLMLDSPDGKTRVLLLRTTDVPTYVEYGVADIGVAGADTLLEDGADLLEPLDLGLGACRMVVAGRRGASLEGTSPWVKVATKYPNIARSYFRQRGIEAVIIKLYGAVELAAISGLADLVVDLVSTGSTLAANDLVELETIAHISSRLVINRASLKTRHAEIDRFVRSLEAAVKTTRTNP